MFLKLQNKYVYKWIATITFPSLNLNEFLSFCNKICRIVGLEAQTKSRRKP